MLQVIVLSVSQPGEGDRSSVHIEHCYFLVISKCALCNVVIKNDIADHFLLPLKSLSQWIEK